MSAAWFAAARQNDFQYLAKNALHHIRSQSPRYSRTALIISAKHANQQVVSLLRREIGIRDIYNRTALMYAAYFNNSAIIPLLEAERQQKCLQFKGLRGATALQIAAEAHNVAICQMLADEAQTSEMTVLHLNALFHQASHDAGADSQKRTPLHYAALNPEEANSDFYRQFSVFSQDITRKTPLHLAVESGNFGLINYVIAEQHSNIFINFESKYGQNTTALMWAVEQRNQKAFRALSYFYLGQCTDTGVTCLMIAVIKGFNEFIAQCFPEEFNIPLQARHGTMDSGTTVFQAAEKLGNLRALEILRMCQYYRTEKPAFLNDTTLRSQMQEKQFSARMRSSSTSVQFNSGLFNRSQSVGKRVSSAQQAYLGVQQSDLRTEALQVDGYPAKSEQSELSRLLFASQRNCRNLKTYLEQQATQLRSYQEKERDMHQRLKGFDFPSGQSLQECVDQLIIINHRLKEENAYLRSNYQSAPPQPKEPASDLYDSLKYSEQKLGRLEGQIAACGKYQADFDRNIDLAKQVRDHIEILALFYGEELPDLGKIRSEAYLLASALHCGFADIATLLEHMETQLGGFEQRMRLLAIQIRSIAGLCGVPNCAGAEVETMVELLQQRIPELQQYASENFGKRESAAELEAQLQVVYQNVRELNSQCLLESRAKAEIYQHNMQLQEKLAGYEAELRACKEQLKQNLTRKAQARDIVCFIAQIAGGQEAPLPEGLTDDEEEVLSLLVKMLGEGRRQI